MNLNRIKNFKRTRKYNKGDFKLLLRVIDKFTPRYTLAHVMAEVSNLTDLNGRERVQARQILKSLLTMLQEPVMASLQAAQSTSYNSHRLIEAAIASLANNNKCTVLTDDLDLYLALSHEGVAVVNFTHLQAREWGLLGVALAVGGLSLAMKKLSARLAGEVNLEYFFCLFAHQ